MKYSIYTDGACSGNPGPGGCGVIIINENEEIVYSFSNGYAETTNNEMELYGFVVALKWCCAHLDENGLATIYVDSAYVYNCFKDKWYIGWIKREWKNASGQPVAHRSLWEQALYHYRLVENRITLSKVAGHSGNEWNEYADKLAVQARKSL